MKIPRLLTIACIATGLLSLPSCRKSPQMTNEVVAIQQASVPADPTNSAWDSVPEHLEKMIPQDLVEPRLLQPSTPELRVRAITDGTKIAFRLTWADSSKNNIEVPARFVDACAVQIPKTIETNPPAPQMGEKGKTVEVVYWRADWQAFVNGERTDTIRDIYPNASIDHYPFQAKSLEPGSKEQKEMATRYAPADAVGNRRVGPRTVPVESLIAEGPGTLSPAASNDALGKGTWSAKNGWSVVIVRKLPDGLSPGVRTQVAFAVWQGSQQEAGARKMRTGWVPLTVRQGQ